MVKFVQNNTNFDLLKWHINAEKGKTNLPFKTQHLYCLQYAVDATRSVLLMATLFPTTKHSAHCFTKQLT